MFPIKAARFHPLHRGTWFPTKDDFIVDISTNKVSIRYIAVLGFQRADIEAMEATRLQVSIRYIAVLGFQRSYQCQNHWLSLRFHPLYRGTWFPTKKYYCIGEQLAVSIRYIAVLGFQPCHKTSHKNKCSRGFHPLHRGTWFPTAAEAAYTGETFIVSIRYIAVLGFQR